MPYLTIKGRQSTCSSRVLNHTYSAVHGRTIDVLLISDPMQGGIVLCMVLIWFSTSFIAHSMTSLLIGHITRECSVSVAWSSLALTNLLSHRSNGRSATTKTPTHRSPPFHHALICMSSPLRRCMRYPNFRSHHTNVRSVSSSTFALRHKSICISVYSLFKCVVRVWR